MELHGSEVPSLDSKSQKCYHIRVAQSCLIEPGKEAFIWGKLVEKGTLF